MVLICVEQTGSSIFVVCLAILSYILCPSILVYGSIKTYQSKKYVLSLRILYYINNICWFCSATGYASTSVLAITESYCPDVLGFWLTLGFWGYGFAFCFLYLIFTYRLRELFINTPYHLSRCQLIIFQIGFITMLITHTISGIGYYTWNWQLAYLFGTIWMFINFICCICLLSVFLCKMRTFYRYVQQQIASHSDMNFEDKKYT